MKKLRNKGTRKIGYLYANKDENYNVLDEDDKVLAVYATLEEVVDEWEDYEELKGIQDVYDVKNYVYIQMGSNEEAKKTVEKIRTLRRLQDKGFKIDLWDYDGGNSQERIQTGRILFSVKDYSDNDEDLNLLLGDK